MTRKTRAERRQHPRIDHALPVSLAVNGYDFSTTTQNVSCTGAYCRIQKYVPAFTKVMVKLDLPVATAKGSKNYCVECKGVVVRTDDEANGGFNIAVFFNKIKNSERQKISQYIKQFLPQ